MSEEFEDLIKHVDAEMTSKRHRQESKDYAEESFKDHVITEEQEGIFYCGKPGTRIHSFRVAFLPEGMIVCYGDIGEMMVQRGEEAWLSGAIRHDYLSDYIMEKTRPGRREERFMPGDALVMLQAMHDGVPFVDEKGVNFVEQAMAEEEDLQDSDWELQPDPEAAIKIAGDWLNYDSCGGDKEAWYRACFEHTSDYDHDYFDCDDYSNNDLWCYWALSWFVRKRAET